MANCQFPKIILSQEDGCPIVKGFLTVKPPVLSEDEGHVLVRWLTVSFRKEFYHRKMGFQLLKNF